VESKDHHCNLPKASENISITAERSVSLDRKLYCLNLMSSSDLMRFSANFHKAGVELQPVRHSDYGEQCHGTPDAAYVMKKQCQAIPCERLGGRALFQPILRFGGYRWSSMKDKICPKQAQDSAVGNLR
jgi:hypothetical protein